MLGPRPLEILVEYTGDEGPDVVVRKLTRCEAQLVPLTTPTGGPKAAW